jgi:phosphate starvation-inducible membrane PsiE
MMIKNIITAIINLKKTLFFKSSNEKSYDVFEELLTTFIVSSDCPTG